jgi:hypothetical protein
LASATKVTWFRNRHEHRNDMLRFGMMRLHRAGEIDYRELPLARCVEFGFPPAVADHEHRHTSVLAVGDSRTALRCVVDSEDSFFFVSPIIDAADVYFCAGYNTDFFVNRSLSCGYDWQTPQEIGRYLERSAELIERFGDQFSIVRKFVPISPHMAPRRAPGFLARKARNLRHRAHRLVSDQLYTRSKFDDFEARYAELLALRDVPLRYDVVLSDTLWGWPRHRLALHRRLASAGRHYRIHAELRWSEPNDWDGSAACPMANTDFPVRTGAVVDYESMLAASRLAVFASGFHWGWRSVMTLALMVGLPVYADRPRLEPWFSLDEFEIFKNESDDWPELETHLESLDEAGRAEIKRRNQACFDRFMSPEAQARYLLSVAA